MLIAFILAFTTFVMTIIILFLPIAGLYKVKLMFLDLFSILDFGSEDEVEEIKENSNMFSMDLKPEQIEKIIVKQEKDVFKDKELPINLKEMKEILKKERQGYSQDNFKYKVEKGIYTKKEDLLNGGSESKYEVIDTEKKSINFKDLEYEYRLSWQDISTVNYYLEEDILDEDLIKKTINSNITDYKYLFPKNKDIKNPFPEDKTYNEELSLKDRDEYPRNHEIVKDNKYTIPFNTRGYNFVDSLAIDSDYKRFEEVTENKTVIRTTEKKKRGKGWKVTSDKRETIKDLQFTYPKLKLYKAITPFYIANYGYKREKEIDKLIDYRVSKSDIKEEVETEEGEIQERVTGTIKTQTWIYKSYDRMKFDRINKKDNSQRFTEFLRAVEIWDIEDFKNVVSLFPGGFYIQKKIKGDFIDIYSNSNISGNLKDYIGNIEIKESELLRPIPLFSQIDSRWGEIRYGDSTIGKAGCGPTAMSMVITGLTKEIVTPVETAEFSIRNNCKVFDGGTTWSFFNLIAPKYGIKSKQYSPSQYKKVIEELEKGNPVIASMAPGHFTQSGHFIVLTGVDKDGLIIVNDSYDPHNRKNKAWDFKIILNEAKQFWSFEKR